MKQTNYTQKELQIIEGFFTDSEWLAIEEALEDYKDYGDNSAKLATASGGVDITGDLTT